MVRRSVSQYHIFFTLLVEAGAEYITQFRKQVYSVSKIKKNIPGRIRTRNPENMNSHVFITSIKFGLRHLDFYW